MKLETLRKSSKHISYRPLQKGPPGVNGRPSNVRGMPGMNGSKGRKGSPGAVGFSLIAFDSRCANFSTEKSVTPEYKDHL